MLRNSKPVYLLVILFNLMVIPAQAGVQRAFVASNGLNSNTSFNCDVAHPSRQFLAAVTVVNPGGEVVALDTAAYGAVTLTKSVTLTAAPGAYAGITAFPGATGVTIATPGVNVVLRGLTINGQGGDYGIKMTAGNKLSIENCVISNFSGAGQYGVSVNTATIVMVHVVDTIVRDNDTGILLQGGVFADISGSKFNGNSFTGIGVLSGAGQFAFALISDTVVAGTANSSGAGTGILAYSETTGSSLISVIRSTIANNNYGISAYATAGIASISLGYSMMAGNQHGFYQSGGTLYSQSNNNIMNNGSNTGVLTPFSPQ